MNVSFRINSERDRLEGWRYFWAKRVIGFRPDVHCARCLVGTYVKPFGVKAATNSAIEITDVAVGGVLYFCGVSDPYRWPRNMHLAATVTGHPDNVVTMPMYTGDVLEVRGVTQVGFSDVKARLNYPARDKSYLTCRNFQFGAEAAATGLIPISEREAA